MIKLIVWSATLAFCAILLLIGIRALRPTPASTSCVQLLSPTTGDVLTVDATTGASRLDARAPFPVPFSPRTSYGYALSPDQTHLLNAIDPTEAGYPVYLLWLRLRGTTKQRLLTPAPYVAENYVWSPDSQHIAFTEMRGWGANSPLANLVIANVADHDIAREAVPDIVDDGWFNRFRWFVWSPDGTLVALSMYYAGGNASGDSTLALRSTDSDHSLYVPLPAEQIEYVTWSPDSQVVVVFTQRTKITTTHSLYVIQRDGQILNHTAFLPTFEPTYNSVNDFRGIEPEKLQWSPDGQYFYLSGSVSNKPQLELFNIAGDRVLPAPISPTQGIGVWAAQPHTLIYLAEYDDHRVLYALDAATGQSTVLQDAVASRFWARPAYATSVLAVVTSHQPDQFTPHVLSTDLAQNTTPFGIIESGSELYPQWSPDSQNLLITSAEHSTFTLRWLLTNSGEVRIFQLPKQGVPYERLDSSWLTNNIILLTYYADEQQTLWYFDTRSSMLVKLGSAPISTGVYGGWHDENYLLVSTHTNLALIRLSDGVALFSDLPLTGGIPVISTDERALLLFSERNSGSANSTLTLITKELTQTVSDTGFVTLPVWSLDGETFAFAARDNYWTDWHVKVISRDGKLLKDISVRSPILDINYDQVRWTNCD